MAYGGGGGSLARDEVGAATGRGRRRLSGVAAWRTRTRRRERRAAGCGCARGAEVAAAGGRGRGQGGPGPDCLLSPPCPAGPDTQSGRSGTPGREKEE